MDLLGQKNQEFTTILTALFIAFGCAAPSGQNGFGTGAKNGINSQDSRIETSENAGTQEKPPANINDVFGDPLKDTIILQYDPEIEKNRITDVILNSDLDEIQKNQAIQYVDNANIAELDTVSKFLDQFLNGLIVTLPKNTPESIEIAVDTSGTATGNLQETDVAKRNKISQDILSEVLKRSTATSGLPKLEIESITREKVQSSGFWTPEESEQVTTAIVEQVVTNPSYVVVNQSGPEEGNQNNPTESNVPVVENVAVNLPEPIPTDNGVVIIQPDNPPVAAENPLNLLQQNSWDINIAANAQGTQTWDGNSMKVDIISNGGGLDWEIQPTHPITLVPGTKYLLTIKGYSTNPIAISARAEARTSPYTGYNWFDFSLNTTPSTHNHEFTYNGPAGPIRLTLNMGKGISNVTYEEISLIVVE